MIIGLLAPASRPAAAAMAPRSSSGGWRGTGGSALTGREPDGTGAASTFLGTAIAVGRGRPDLAW